ncbi:hypothetical protein B0H13DRAFT_1871248 [Mycena leptocephala]|nr:hypothetical protein B0H13DRAFT_1871248 [Mycena leptocephala]
MEAFRTPSIMPAPEHFLPALPIFLNNKCERPADLKQEGGGFPRPCQKQSPKLVVKEAIFATRSEKMVQLWLVNHDDNPQATGSTATNWHRFAPKPKRVHIPDGEKASKDMFSLQSRPSPNISGHAKKQGVFEELPYGGPDAHLFGRKIKSRFRPSRKIER